MRNLLLIFGIASFPFFSFADISINLNSKYLFELGSRIQKDAYVDQLDYYGDINNPGPSYSFYPGFGRLSTNSKNSAFFSKAIIGVKIEGKNDTGFVYGANINLLPRTVYNTSHNGSYTEKSFLFCESNIGRIEIGSYYSVETVMNIGAQSVAAAIGGASDGEWSHYYYFNGEPSKNIYPNITTNNSGGLGTNPISLGTSYAYRAADYFPTDKEGMRKISYVTPKFNGLQLGISYTPDANNPNNLNGTSNSTTSDFQYAKNIVALAGLYEKIIADFNFSLSAAYSFSGVRDSSFKTGVNRLSDYQIGFKLTKGYISFAASYGDAGKSLRKKNISFKPKQNYLSLGLGYKINKLSLSVTYLSSKNSEMGGGYTYSPPNDLNNTYFTLTGPGRGSITRLSAYSIGTDYLITQGFKAYTEITFVSVSNPAIQSSLSSVQYKSNNITYYNNPAPKNSGKVFLLGGVLQI